MKTFQQQFFKKAVDALFVVAVYFLIFASLINNSYSATATDRGVGRTRICDSSGVPDGLDFNPSSLGNNGGGKDMEFVMSNPVCATIFLISYAKVKYSIAVMNGACGSGSKIPRVQPSPIRDTTDIAIATINLAAKPSQACAIAYGQALLSWNTALAQLGVVYTIAKDTYDNTEVCGATWLGPDVKKYDMSLNRYKQSVQDIIDNYIEKDQTKLAFTDKSYREWYYGGEEVEDDPVNESDICYDPTVAKKPGYKNYARQKYYLRGLSPGNYNCKKYDILPGMSDPITKEAITEARTIELRAAYDCCKKRSQEYICINFKASGALEGKKRFCKAGSLCAIKGITFSAKFVDNNRFICAESYSLCPYNFSIGGGSEYCEYYQDGKWDSNKKSWTMITRAEVEEKKECSTKSEIRNSDCTYNDKSGKCMNYCQHMTHCTQSSAADFKYKSGLGSPYFSDACINFVGDSQNMSEISSGNLIIGSQKHFSAPIAQCVRETLENVFYNRAGHSECYSSNEYPSASGICNSGNYAQEGKSFIYKKGNTVKKTSFFSRIQNSMQDIVKLVLTFSIIFYGMNILVGKANIGDKKDILKYLVKIGLVLYFATGDAWQTQFFEGVYSASSELSQIVFKISADANTNMRDGCQFGKIYLSNHTVEASSQNYPAGKEYLALWDTLDCKITRYLGFGPEASVANIVALILSFYFSGTIGVYFAMAFLVLGFFFVAVTMRALHIFLSSCLSIIIMVFVSPIIIPLCLFEKTSNIFQEWLKNLISFCLQPMILFMYIAFFIMVIDKTMIGSASFSGSPPSKTLSCKKICKNSNGTVVGNKENGSPPECDGVGQRFVDPLNDSVVCMVSFDSYGVFHAFDFLGITLPNLTGFFSTDSQSMKAKVLTILRGALVMYLLTQFVDEIPGITSALIGGNSLPGTKVNGMEALVKAMGMVAAAQKRLARGLKKHGGKAARDLMNKANSQARSSGDKGKSAADSGAGEKGGGKDEAKDSGGGGGKDEAKDSGGGGDGGGDSGGGGDGGGDSKGGGDEAKT